MSVRIPFYSPVWEEEYEIFPRIHSGRKIRKPEQPLSELRNIVVRSVNDFKSPGIQAEFLKRGEVPIFVLSGTFDLKHNKQQYNKNVHSDSLLPVCRRGKKVLLSYFIDSYTRNIMYSLFSIKI